MRVQSDHWAVILDFAEQHPEIITNKSKSLKGREVLQQSWKELTVMLNSLGMGEKNIEEWKKTIIDWKSKTKAKAVSIRTHLGGTGGGPPQNVTLTSFEERLLSIMGKVAVEGNPKVMEVGLKRSISPLHIVPEQQPPLKQIKLNKPIFLTLKNSQCMPFLTTHSQSNKKMLSTINKEYTDTGRIHEFKENEAQKNNQPPSSIDETYFADQTQNQANSIRIIAEEPQAQGLLKIGSCETLTQIPDKSNISITTPHTTSYSLIENNRKTTPISTYKGTSSRHRETQLSVRLESMNNSVLEVLERMDNKISKIADHLGELVDAIKDLKK